MGSTPPFPNDGSFLERFKQMQGSVAAPEQPTTTSSSSNNTGAQPVNITIKKTVTVAKSGPAAPPGNGNGNGKLTFSLKAKAKPSAVNPLKLGDNEEEEVEEQQQQQPKDRGTERQAKKQKVEQPDGVLASGPPPPADPDVRRVADKLASFVAKTGKEFEDITRQKNPTDLRFGFLFDVNCADYKYYQHRLAEEELLLKSQAANTSQAVVPPRQQPKSSQRPNLQSASSATNFQTPASALFENGEEAYDDEQDSAKQESNSLAMMEFYMKKAAQNDLRKPSKFSKDEMPPPPSLSAPTAQKRGHHMGDYIPQEELEKFMAKCNDAVSQKQILEATERAKIQADNIGHRLLSKMGWKEGEGLGSAGVGRSDPVQSGQVKLNNLGLGAENPGDVNSEDDIYEQYKKRMMLGYRFRPNPLNNPRKAYY